MTRSFAIGALLGALGLVIWGVASQAQVIDADPCQQACNRAHAICIERCGEGDNPMECDSACNDSRQDCMQECGC